MKKIVEFVYTFSFQTLKYISILFSFILFLGAFLYSSADTDITTLKTFIVKDNIFVSTLCILIFLGLMMLIKHICEKHPDKTKRVLLFITLGFYALLGTFLILYVKSTPHTDSHFIYTIAKNFAQNNFSDISLDSYLSIYPHQIGLAFFYEPLIRLWNLIKIPVDAYIFLQFVNLVLVLIFIIFLYKLVNMWFENSYVTCCCLILTLCCFPLYFYILRIYGDVVSITFLMIGLWAFTKLLTSTRTSHKAKVGLYLLNITCFILSVATRKNTIISLIALMLIIVLISLHKKIVGFIPLILAYLIISLFTLPLIQNLYETRADAVLGAGTPAIAYIAMGMEDAPKASGWYNGFNYNIYLETDHNIEFIETYCKKKIENRLDYFKSNKDKAFNFYFEKYASQWCDGTYAFRELTSYSATKRPEKINDFYSENGGKLILFVCNQFQTILYFGFFVFSVYNGFFRKEKNVLVYSIVLMAFGGFLFHFLWEANARAIFSYIVFLLPVAGAGIATISSAKINTKFIKK